MRHGIGVSCAGPFICLQRGTSPPACIGAWRADDGRSQARRRLNDRSPDRACRTVTRGSPAASGPPRLRHGWLPHPASGSMIFDVETRDVKAAGYTSVREMVVPGQELANTHLVSPSRCSAMVGSRSDHGLGALSPFVQDAGARFDRASLGQKLLKGFNLVAERLDRVSDDRQIAIPVFRIA